MQRHPELFSAVGKSYMHRAGALPGQHAANPGARERRARDRVARARGLRARHPNAHLDLRIVADVMQDGVAGYFATYWAVRKDGPIKDFADMRSHRAAVNAFGARPT